MQPNTELQSHCQVFLGTDAQKQMDWHHKKMQGQRILEWKDHGILLENLPLL